MYMYYRSNTWNLYFHLKLILQVDGDLHCKYTAAELGLGSNSNVSMVKVKGVVIEEGTGTVLNGTAMVGVERSRFKLHIQAPDVYSPGMGLYVCVSTIATDALPLIYLNFFAEE